MSARTFPRSLCAAALLAVAAQPLAAQAEGALDTSYGTSGYYAFSPVLDTDPRRVEAAAIAADGRIVTVQTNGTLPDYDTQMCRINANGNGRFCVDLAQNLGYTNLDRPSEVLVQPDDKRVIVGFAAKSLPSPLEGKLVGYVLRTSSIGDYDGSFSGDGKAYVEPTVGNGDVAFFAAALQSDGRIVVGGLIDTTPNATIGPASQGLVARLTSTGALDTTFSGDGLVALPSTLGGDSALVHDLAILRDGRILVAVHSETDGFTLQPVVCRLTASGELDGTFAGGGCVQVESGLPTGVTNRVEKIAVDRFGRIVIAGVSYTSGAYGRAFVARLTAGGSPDAGFGGGDGAFEILVSGTDDVQGLSGLVLMPPPSDGIVVTGRHNPGSHDLAYVVKLTPAGGYDTSFSQDGKLSIEVPGLGPHAAGRGLVSQAGRLVVAGDFIATDDEQIWTARVHQSQIFGDDFDAGHLDLWSAKATGN
jgi:uncharacterized delta-60 repeat protein